MDPAIVHDATCGSHEYKDGNRLCQTIKINVSTMNRLVACEDYLVFPRVGWGVAYQYTYFHYDTKLCSMLIDIFL